jgi:sigma-B regulation protein RsbU (phosphoserine phosphatase)
MTADATVIDVTQDWVTASHVQQRFMQGTKRGYRPLDYSARCRQVLELGGDCYDFVPLLDQRLGIVIGDASGKGLAASLMMANVLSSIRTAALFTGNDVLAALSAVNRQVHASSLPDRYATLFYGVFDERTRTLRYCNAGNNPPLLVRRNGLTVWLETGGAPVGMFADWKYEEGAVALDPGDVLVAYSDGVTETLNPAGEEWGPEGLRKATVESVARPADGLVRAIFASMDAFSQGRQTDDATVVVLRVP